VTQPAAEPPPPEALDALAADLLDDDDLRPSPALERVDRYEVIRPLGQGASADVYLAVDARFERQVAVKVFRPGQASPRRFRREMEALAALQHPGIVRIHEAGEHEGRLYYVMDHVGAGSLADADLPLERFAQILQRVALACHHAHACGIVHRDLKPENVLLADSDAGGPIVTDFGVAKFLDRATRLSRTGSLVGTPAYMAPEQLLGEPITPQTDVYALGAILYERLAGRLPFEADSFGALAVRILEGDPTPPRRLDPTVPADLEAVALRCLAASPAERYGSAEELARALSAARARPSVETPASAASDREGRGVARFLVPASVGAGLVALLALGVVLALGPGEAPPEGSRAPPVADAAAAAPETSAASRPGSSPPATEGSPAPSSADSPPAPAPVDPAPPDGAAEVGGRSDPESGPEPPALETDRAAALAARLDAWERRPLAAGEAPDVDALRALAAELEAAGAAEVAAGRALRARVAGHLVELAGADWPDDLGAAGERELSEQLGLWEAALLAARSDPRRTREALEALGASDLAERLDSSGSRPGRVALAQALRAAGRGVLPDAPDLAPGPRALLSGGVLLLEGALADAAARLEEASGLQGVALRARRVQALVDMRRAADGGANPAPALDASLSALDWAPTAAPSWRALEVVLVEGLVGGVFSRAGPDVAALLERARSRLPPGSSRPLARGALLLAQVLHDSRRGGRIPYHRVRAAWETIRRAPSDDPLSLVAGATCTLIRSERESQLPGAIEALEETVATLRAGWPNSPLAARLERALADLRGRARSVMQPRSR